MVCEGFGSRLMTFNSVLNVKVRAGRQAIESIQVLCYRSRFLFCSVQVRLADRT